MSDIEVGTIEEVRDATDGWEVKFSNGWSLYVPRDNDESVIPEKGMESFTLGKMGLPIRGLFLGGRRV